MLPMRKLLLLVLSVMLAISIASLFAQGPPEGKEGKKKAPPKNLQVLPADANLIPTMQAAAAGLGVMCNDCHEADRSGDAKPMKVTARMMFSMVKDINSKFPDGKVHVTCYTCHRGQQQPLTAPPPA